MEVFAITPTIGGRACAVLLALVIGAACGAGTPRSRVETPANMSGYTSYRWWRPPLNEGPRGYSEDEAVSYTHLTLPTILRV